MAFLGTIYGMKAFSHGYAPSSEIHARALMASMISAGQKCNSTIPPRQHKYIDRTINQTGPHTRHQATKRLAERQVPDDIERSEIIPLCHVRALLGRVDIQLRDQYIDILLDDVLLLQQRLRREPAAEQFQHARVLLGIARRRKIRVCSVVVPARLEERRAPCCVSVDVPPRGGRREGERVRRNSQHCAVLRVQRGDCLRVFPADPVFRVP